MSIVLLNVLNSKSYIFIKLHHARIKVFMTKKKKEYYMDILHTKNACI